MAAWERECSCWGMITKDNERTFWSNQKFLYLNGSTYMVKYLCQNSTVRLKLDNFSTCNLYLDKVDSETILHIISETEHAKYI